MKYFLIFFLAAVSCTSTTQQATEDTATVVTDTSYPTPTPTPADTITTQPDTTTTSTPKVYGNNRFKDVTVEKVGTDTYRVKGKAQVFEAAFSWVVEDGHNELKKGHEMTDAGAPAFGNFSFTITVPKARPNSTLHLLLFEASAKDGSRQHQLFIPLG